MIRFKMIYLVAVLMLLGICGVSFGTVTTNATGQLFQLDWDMTQYVSDGLVGNPVVYYNATTGLFELDDAFAGGVLIAPTMQGSILFGNLAGGTFDETTTTAASNEIFWDDINKALGIGPDADDDTDEAYLVVEDDTLVTTTDFTGIASILTSTSTAAGDDLYGMQASLDYDATGDTATSMTGAKITSIMTDGTLSGNLFGASIDLDMVAAQAANSIGLLNVGTYNGALTITDDIRGISNFVDLDAVTLIADDVTCISNTLNSAVDVGGDVFGYNGVINQTAGTITGAAYGIYNNTTYDGTAVTGTAVGIYNNVAHTSTVGANTFGIHNEILVDGSLTGDARGIYDYIVIDDDVSNDVSGIELLVSQTNGIIANDVFGIDASVVQGVGGTISGDASVVHVSGSWAGTVTGTSYGVKIDDVASQDVAFHQEGTTVKPWVAMTITNGDNDNAALPNGTNCRITVTAADNASNLGGMTTGYDGQMVTLFNFTAAENITIEDAEIAEGGGFSPIWTCFIGGDVTIGGLGNITLVYSSTDSAWVATAYLL